MAISDFIEPAVKDFATQATATYSAPINTNVFMGTGTGANPFVAQEDALQTQAINLAQQGVGSYAPYLQAATAAQNLGAGQVAGAAGTVAGLGGLTGGLTGIPGPPVILLYVASSHPISVIRANNLLFLYFFDVCVVLIFALSGVIR